jgi:glycosyltransferase involved in cell wall biosynthesis
LFPTQLDPWGVVANEACAVGTPVITCANAGAANDLILQDYNGYVLELDTATWCEHVWQLLTDSTRWHTFSENALNKVQEYSYDNAADGIINALKYCEKKP